jgi:Domain of unknown function (DUF4410)
MVLLSSCAPSHVQMTDIYAGPRLPRPDRVVVSSFTVSAQDVKPDQGVGPRLLRAIEAEPYSAAELQEARKAQATVAAELVKELQKYGLAAEPGGTVPPPQGRTVLVEGRIIGINDGNRTRRTLIGAGAGESSITADAWLLYSTGAMAPQTLASFAADSNSGRMPGMALPVGIGTHAGHAATSAALSVGLQGSTKPAAPRKILTPNIWPAHSRRRSRSMLRQRAGFRR